MIRGKLARRVGNQRALRWARLAHYVQKMFGWITLDIELGAPLSAQCLQFGNVRITGMALVFTRMQCDTVCS